MYIPLLQKERSIDDFVDAAQGCRLAALIADTESVNQEEELYTLEVQRLVGTVPQQEGAHGPVGNRSQFFEGTLGARTKGVTQLALGRCAKPGVGELQGIDLADLC